MSLLSSLLNKVKQVGSVFPYSAFALHGGALILKWEGKALGSHSISEHLYLFTCQVRELYKQRLEEVDMLEKHIIQARARTLAEQERCVQQLGIETLGSVVEMPPGVLAFLFPCL